METIIILIISLIFIVLGLVISKYKCYWLISGYNTYSKEEKSRVEIDKVAKHMGRMFYLISLVLFLAGIVSYYIEISTFPFIIVIMIIIFGYLVYMQRYDHNKKSKSETIFIVVIAFITFFTMIIVFSSGKEPNEIRVEDSNIIIDGSFGTTIEKEDINEVSIVDEIPKITMKINGYSDGSSVEKGEFRLENGDKVKLYIQSNKGPYIKISTNSYDIYINYEDNNKTIKSFNNFK
ncbi:MAG: DUF3784 domain-containing protein [Clostridium sartagoforme]|nr:DUF3784 domain-containing protein [Clostridium sartagoforme]